MNQHRRLRLLSFFARDYTTPKRYSVSLPLRGRRLWPIAIALATLLACGWQSAITIPARAGVTTDVGSHRQSLLITQAQTSPSLPAAKQKALPPALTKAQTSLSLAAEKPTALPTTPNEKVPLRRLRQLGYLCVALGGAFGGLIYSISRNSGAIMPHLITLPVVDSKQTYVKWNLGILADILVGIGGGILIFSLIPQAGSEGLFETLWKDEGGTEGRVFSLLMKILALSLIGGFAGISLFDEAAKRINNEIKDISDQAKSNRDAINIVEAQAKSSRDAIEDFSQGEADIQFYLSRIVDRSIGQLTPSEKEKFRAAVVKAPLHLRNKVFTDCQRSLEANRVLSLRSSDLSVPDLESRLEHLEGLTIGFDSLIAAADEQVRKGQPPDIYEHRYIAQLGFIQQQLAEGSEILGRTGDSMKHWNSAVTQLVKAIELRDKTPERQDFWHYDLAHIYCLFKLGRKDEASVQLNISDAQSWASNKSQAVLIANFSGFRTQARTGEVLEVEDFLRWVESKTPGVVPKELL